MTTLLTLLISIGLQASSLEGVSGKYQTIRLDRLEALNSRDSRSVRIQGHECSIRARSKCGADQCVKLDCYGDEIEDRDSEIEPID